MTRLSIRRNWKMYCDIMFRDNTTAPSKGGRAFSREFAHTAFKAGARSTLQVLAHMLERGEIDELHRPSRAWPPGEPTWTTRLNRREDIESACPASRLRLNNC